MVESLYIHIPFCSYKCPYCDFTSLVRTPISKEEYLGLLLKEAELYRDTETALKTLYIGGGTPTLLEPDQLGRLIGGIDLFLDLSKVEEITVECNPETYRYDEFKALLDLGFNRLSIGVQSFVDRGLRSLGREHSVGRSVIAYREAREAGFENINIDLIYAYPGQRVEDIDTELEYIKELSPEHVSAYMLTPYEGTPMGTAILSGNLDVPEEEEVCLIYEALWRGLKSLGYERYEVSNWSIEGRECRHNLSYWEGREFIGLGVSAWGFVGGLRYGNTKNLLSYKECLLEGRKPIQSVSPADPEEKLMLQLRLKWGLTSEEKHLIPEGLLNFFEERDGRLGIREEYMLLSNEIITELLLYNSHRKSMEVRDG